jgi:uncharacterized protein YbgA (DUF1722 family)/uncharacterized protein YbbK (DUF523 family)
MVTRAMHVTERPQIGISSCLLGEEVRYDGGHKHSRYITKTLGQHFEFVSYCPEMAIGLGIPRPPIRLVARDHGVVAVGVEDDSLDVTARLSGYAHDVARKSTHLSGYILKKDSPSCGMERVRVYDGKQPQKKGTGVYAGELMRRLPNLPMEEEGRLMDPGLRENFVERVFTFHRWQQMLAAGLTAGRLVDFHTRHKFSVLAHDEKVYRELGRLVADAGGADIPALAERYIALLMTAMRKRATPRKHANVLMHIMGFFKDRLDTDDKEEMLALIDAHRQELVPLIVPITLINHFLRKFPNEYIQNQVYLSPHPRELMLRNHI